MGTTGPSLPQPNITITGAVPPPHFPKLGEIVQYVKHHEKLVGLALLLAVGWFAYGKAVDFIERHDIRTAAVENERLRAQAEKNAEIAAQNAKLAADYKSLAEQVLAQNTALQQAIAARDAATKKQQEKDRTLPPDALAARWQELVKLPPLSVQPTAAGAFQVTAPAATETVVQLEEIPKLQGDLKDSQAQAANLQGQVAKGEQVVSGLHTQIDGLNTQIVDQQKACAASLILEKAKARKAKRNWFVRGLLIGGTVASYILHH